jgi:hypothetical protein
MVWAHSLLFVEFTIDAPPIRHRNSGLAEIGLYVWQADIPLSRVLSKSVIVEVIALTLQ